MDRKESRVELEEVWDPLYVLFSCFGDQGSELRVKGVGFEM